jgi:hypothetical protein
MVILPKADFQPELLRKRFIEWHLQDDPNELVTLERVCLGARIGESVEATRRYLQSLGYGRPGQAPVPKLTRSQHHCGLEA